MDNQAAIAILTKKLEEWESKPKEDSYQYEKSFVEVMQGLSEELLQLSVGEVPQDRNQKKSSDSGRADHGQERACS